MPPWIQAENISWYEQSELNILKCFTYVPVVITFGVFAFLLVYYVAVSTPFLSFESYFRRFYKQIFGEKTSIVYLSVKLFIASLRNFLNFP